MNKSMNLFMRWCGVFDHCVRFYRVRKSDATDGQSSIMTLCSTFNNVFAGPHGIMFALHLDCYFHFDFHYCWHRVHHHPVYPCHLDSMFHRQYHFAVISDLHDFATVFLPLLPISFENRIIFFPIINCCHLHILFDQYWFDYWIWMQTYPQCVIFHPWVGLSIILHE